MKCARCHYDPPRGKSATARMESARNAQQAVWDDVYRAIRLWAQLWPSHVSRASNAPKHAKEDDWTHVVCIHTPKGNFYWRISEEKADEFFLDWPNCEPCKRAMNTSERRAHMLNITPTDIPHPLTLHAYST